MVNLDKKKKNLKNLEMKFQKNRFFQNPKNIKLVFGESCILNLKEGRLELIQINFMRRLLKKITKKSSKTISRKRERVWYFGRPNFYLQRKAKNSRMGKGKGTPERKVLRIANNFKIFEFLGVSIFKLKWFLKRINKKSGLRFILYTPNIRYTRNWFKLNTSKYYYSKYLYYTLNRNVYL